MIMAVAVVMAAGVGRLSVIMAAASIPVDVRGVVLMLMMVVFMAVMLLVMVMVMSAAVVRFLRT